MSYGRRSGPTGATVTVRGNGGGSGSGRRGTNLPRMADYNQLVVLDRIRRAREGVSRVELAESTGLSGQTISNAVNRLIERGLVLEGDRQIHGRGKPRTMLRLRAESGYALGCHIDPVSLSFAVVDLAGRAVDRSMMDTPVGPEAVVAAVAAEVTRLRERNNLAASDIIGLGVAVPGPIDAARGRAIAPPLLEGWGTVPLRDLVSEATGLPTLVEKDVTAAMAAELWQRHHDVWSTTLFAYLGFGTGFAFAHRGEVLKGSSQNAGEVGHLIVDADGPLCPCGNRGCLAFSVSLAYLVGQAVEVGALPSSTPRGTPRELDRGMVALAAAAAGGDEAAVAILELAARRLARGLMVVADLVDADSVVVGGANAERLAPYLERAAASEFAVHATMRELHTVQVEGSAVGTWVGAVGAASLVLDEAFTPKAALLVHD